MRFRRPRRRRGRRRARPWNTAPASSSATTARSSPTARSPTAASTVAIAGFGNADRVAEDKEHDLALLRIYGARGLKPLNLANAAAKTALDLTGIADPQNQGGGAAVSSVKASVAQLGGGSDVALSPAPALGFSGAAALDGDGKFAGIALLKPVQVAGPTERRARGAGGAGDGRYGARFPQGQWRQCGRRIERTRRRRWCA